MTPSNLTTEAANPASTDIDRLSALEIVQAIDSGGTP
jgi:N-acetylmuramic acid 6-phosphate (MurNAc-6-P) etherase